MSILRGNIEIEIVLSKSGSDRYVLKKLWDVEKPIVTVLTLYPSTDDVYIDDLTTNLITRNVYKKGFGGFYIVNLYSKLLNKDDKIEFRNYKNKDNDKYILDCVRKSELMIIACGSLPSNNRTVGVRLQNILKMLNKEGFEDKIQYLTDCDKIKNYHPLSSKVRNNWEFL